MDANQHEALAVPGESVSHSEADEMLRRVLAGQAEFEPRKPLTEVAATLGLSEALAQRMLQEIRAKKITDLENQRINKGLKREKNVMRMALLCSVFGIALIGGGAYVGTHFLFPHPIDNGAQMLTAPANAEFIELNAAPGANAPAVVLEQSTEKVAASGETVKTTGDSARTAPDAGQ